MTEQIRYDIYDASGDVMYTVWYDVTSEDPMQLSPFPSKSVYKPKSLPQIKVIKNG